MNNNLVHNKKMGVTLLIIILFSGCGKIQIDDPSPFIPIIGSLDHSSVAPGSKVIILDVENITDDINKIKVIIDNKENITTKISDQTIEFYTAIMDEGDYDLFVISNSDTSNVLTINIKSFDELDGEPGDKMQETLYNFSNILNTFSNNIVPNLVNEGVLTPYQSTLFNNHNDRLKNVLSSLGEYLSLIPEDTLKMLDNLVNTADINLLLEESALNLNRSLKRGNSSSSEFKLAENLLALDLLSSMITAAQGVSKVLMVICASIGLVPGIVAHTALEVILGLFDATLDGLLPTDISELNLSNASVEFDIQIGETRLIEYEGVFKPQSDPVSEALDFILETSLSIIPIDIQPVVNEYVQSIFQQAGFSIYDNALGNISEIWQDNLSKVTKVSLAQYEKTNIFSNQSIVSFDMNTMNIAGIDLGYTELTPYVYRCRPSQNNFIQAISFSFEYPQVLGASKKDDLFIHVKDGVDSNPPNTIIVYAGISETSETTSSANAYISWNAEDDISEIFLYDIYFQFKGNDLYSAIKTDITSIDLKLTNVEDTDTLSIFVVAYDEYGNRDFTPAMADITTLHNPLADPILVVEPASLNIISGQSSGSFTVKNISTGTLNFSVDVITGSNWLEASISQGSVSSFSSKNFSVNGNVANTSMGLNYGKVKVSSAYGDKYVDVHCTEVTPASELIVSPTSINFGTNPKYYSEATEEITIKNTGLAELEYSVEIVSGDNWLDLLGGSYSHSGYLGHGGMATVDVRCFIDDMSYGNNYGQIRVNSSDKNVNISLSGFKTSPDDGNDDDDGNDEDNDIYGCTDPNANNYNSNATLNDESCTYDSSGNDDISGCTDPNANNYNSNATTNDGSCTYDSSGGPQFRIYNSVLDFHQNLNTLSTTIENSGEGTLTYTLNISSGDSWLDILSGGSGSLGADQVKTLVLSCDRGNLSLGENNGRISVSSNGGGITTIYVYAEGSEQSGCTDPNANNYDPDATINDGNCTFDSAGEGSDPGPNGDPTITLTWSYTGGGEGPDIDLWVTDPLGQTLSASWTLGSMNTPEGGRIDYDDQGDTGPGDGGGPERAYWPDGQAPQGTYTYGINYWNGYGTAYYTLKVYKNYVLYTTKTGSISSSTKTLGTITNP